MRRVWWSVSGVFAGSLVFLAPALAAEPRQMWQVEGLAGPESAVLDREEGTLYVSNINGGATDVDGNGYITKLSLQGEILEQHWAEGLNAPKGLALHAGKLYVADIDELVVIDTSNGEIVAKHKAPGASFLNDVTVHQDGRVFVSDMLENQIWKLEGDQIELWVEGEALANPNGVLAEPDRLLVAAWGGKPKDDLSTDVLGHLKAVDYATGEITDVGNQPVGNLDGLEPDGQGGYLVTDWIGGGLYSFGPDGKAGLIMDMSPGSADLEFVENQNLAVIPMMLDGTVVAYEIR